MEDEIRRGAVRNYSPQGESPKTIYTDLNLSREWFYTWLRRYQYEVEERERMNHGTDSGELHPTPAPERS